MHGDTVLLLTFVFALVAAFAGGLVARALRLPAIVGYLLGGFAVGPFTPGFIGDSGAMSQLSEVGVMFMMFGVGMHFSIRDLLEVKGVAVPGAVLQIALGTGAGYALALALGWTPAAGVMLGLSVSIASTVVLIRNLSDAGLYQSAGGRIATGWLIVEDLATIVILVVLPVVFGPEQVSGAELAVEVVRALAATAAFVALMLVVGARVLPWLLGRIARVCSREMFQLAVVVVALGVATVASIAFDVSVALGAFLAGVVVSSSPLSHRIAAEAVPFQDLFSIIFFASVGMMVNPFTLAAHLPELIAIALLVIVGKWVINMALGALFSAGVTSTLTVAAGLSQIGEFSFIIGQLGLTLGVLSSEQYSLILGAAVVSIALNSFALKAVAPLASAMEGSPVWRALYERRTHAIEPPAESTLCDHVVVVGYGHAGRSVADVIARLDLPCLVVERDVERGEQAEADGFPVLLGDAANSRILEHAALCRARVLVVAIEQEAAVELIAREVHELACELPVVARAETDDCVAALAALGVGDVVRPELEGGIELMSHTLARLGYRPRQIQGYANDLRASGYEALGDGRQLARVRAMERLMASLSDVDLHWVEVGEGSDLAGKTLAESDLRARTGAQVFAQRRGEDARLFVGPGDVLRAGDCLGLMGTPDQIAEAERLLAGEGAPPCRC